jgi:hypothetical protein
MDPLSCLAHESSSLCSFQGTRCDSWTAGDRITNDERNRCASRAVPSKLNSAAPLYRAFPPIDFVAQSLTVCRPLRSFASRAREKFAVHHKGDSLLREPRNRRLKNVGLVVLIQPLAINGRVNPELRASSVVDLMMYTPLRSR